MPEKKLGSYRGPLSASEIAAGMNCANANSRRLAEDAQLLLTAGRFPTAASIAALAIEESGKVSVLRQLSIASSKEEVAAAWKNYRSHTRKNAHWMIVDLALKGARKLEDLLPLYEDGAEHPFILDQLKQLGFYTDCLGNRHWSVPVNVVDEALARGLVRIAGFFVAKYETTVEEVELWIKYIGTAQKGHLGASQKALANWYTAMQDAGLRPRGVNKMERFINEGVAFSDL